MTPPRQLPLNVPYDLERRLFSQAADLELVMAVAADVQPIYLMLLVMPLQAADARRLLVYNAADDWDCRGTTLAACCLFVLVLDILPLQSN